MPSGGDGFYYFSAYFVVYYYEFARLDIQINGETICNAHADRNTSDNADPGHTSCSAVTFAVEGKVLQRTLEFFRIGLSDAFLPVYLTDLKLHRTKLISSKIVPSGL